MTFLDNAVFTGTHRASQTENGRCQHAGAALASMPGAARLAVYGDLLPLVFGLSGEWLFFDHGSTFRSSNSSSDQFATQS